MLVIEMDVRLHTLSHPSGDESFDRSLFLDSDLSFFFIVPLPLRGEEVCETTQPLTFSLDFSLPFTEMTQLVNISCDPCIPNGLDGPRYDVVHLEAFSQ